MRRLITLLGVLLVLGLCSGCLTRLRADVLPDANLSKDYSYYVQHRFGDERGIDVVLRDQLRRWGRQAESGERESMPDDTDVLVTYEDIWTWDFTMFMVSLDVKFRDPENEAVLASARSTRGSLARKSAEFMANETIEAIFQKGDPNEAPPPPLEE